VKHQIPPGRAFFFAPKYYSGRKDLLPGGKSRFQDRAGVYFIFQGKEKEKASVLSPEGVLRKPACDPSACQGKTLRREGGKAGL
jgi:hypothetical protein